MSPPAGMFAARCLDPMVETVLGKVQSAWWEQSPGLRCIASRSGGWVRAHFDALVFPVGTRHRLCQMDPEGGLWTSFACIGS